MQDGQKNLVKALLLAATEGVSAATRAAFVKTVHDEHTGRQDLLENAPDRSPESSDALFFFLTENLEALQGAAIGDRDAVARGLLETYALVRRPGPFCHCLVSDFCGALDMHVVVRGLLEACASARRPSASCGGACRAFW